MMEDLMGVILCGGQSRRMGSDKGLFPTDGTIWAKKMGRKLTALDIEVVYSINTTQYHSYLRHFTTTELVIDSVAAEGPLKGLLSVHEKFPEQHLLLMACDMPDMDEATIRDIISSCSQYPGYDCYVYQDAAFAQPFCGIYRSAGLEVLLNKIGTGELKNYSMQHVLNGSNTKRITIGNLAAFTNYNEKKSL